MFRPPVLRAARGHASIEHTIAVALVAIAALGTIAMFGDAVATQASCAARRVADGVERRCARPESESSGGGHAASGEAAALGASDADTLSLAAFEPDDASGASVEVVAPHELDGESATAAQREPLAGTPEPAQQDACGSDALCHAGRVATAAWEESEGLRGAALAAAAWAANLSARLTWIAGPIPIVLPGQERDLLAFRTGLLLGAGEWFVRTGEAVLGAGRWLVERQVHALEALGRGDAWSFFATQTGVDLIDDIPKLWDIAQAIPPALWQQLDTIASGEPEAAGRAAASFAMDVATTVVPVAWSTKPLTTAAAAARRAVTIGQVLERATPEVSRALLPKPIQDWLYAEQRLLSRSLDTRRIISPTKNAQDPLFRPESARAFAIETYWVDAADAHVFTADAVPAALERTFFRTVRGRRQARLLVHPESEQLYADVLRNAVRGEDLYATPTSSSRTLLVWSPGHERAPFFVKTSLDVEIGGVVRNIRMCEVTRSVGCHRMLVREPGLPSSFDALPEVISMMPHGMERGGMVVRSIPQSILTGQRRYVPLFSLYASPPGGGPPMLARMVRQSGGTTTELVRTRIIRPFVEEWTAMLRGHGITSQPHAQNLLVRVGDDGLPVGEFMHRDMAGFTFDFDYRARHGMRPPPDDLPIIRDRAQDYHEADVATHADKIETYFAGGFVYNLDQEVPGWIRMGWVPDEPLEPGAFERILHEEMERAGTPTGPVH